MHTLIHASIVVVLAITSIIAFRYGRLVSADPEGRGGKAMAWIWGISALCAVGFVADCIAWYRG